MMKLRTLTASLLISTCIAGHTMAQESSALDAEIAAIDSQITEVDATIARLTSKGLRSWASGAVIHAQNAPGGVALEGTYRTL